MKKLVLSVTKELIACILILAVSGLLVGCAGTPLHDAVSRGDINTVNKLLNEGVDVNIKGAGGYTPLHWAAEEGRIDMVKLLIEKGADTNANIKVANTPLTQAVLKGHFDIAKLLIQKGADFDFEMGRFEGLSDNPDPEWRARGRAGVKLLERLKPKHEIASQPQPSQSITKEELKTIVQAAVEGAKTQKQEKKSIIRTDIEEPAFNTTDKIMGENDLAVIIGIEGYQGLPKSDYSYDDAKLMGDYAKALGFKPRNIELLLDERATKSAIEKIIKTWLPNKAKPESRVFVYYSGHGAPEPKTGDAYIVPFDGDPNYLPDTGYPLKSLYDTLGKLQVAEVTVVIDACFSGAGGRSVLAKGARPLVMLTEGAILSQNMAVLSATQGTQISTSSSEKGHGVFTYYFLKALKDGKKNIAEIYEYIKPIVEDEAKQLNVQQSPSINPDVEILKGRFGLRR